MNKTTNLLLTVIASCLLIQVALSIFRSPPIVATNDGSAIPVVVENKAVTVSLDDSIRLSLAKIAIPVSIEGFNGHPFVGAAEAFPARSSSRVEALPVQIVPQ